VRRYVPFSKRQRLAADSGKPLVYQYDKVPRALRVQVVLILKRVLGSRLEKQWGSIGDPYTVSMRLWSRIFRFLQDETGTFQLSQDNLMPDEQICNFILQADCAGFIDAVEFSLVSRRSREQRH
jgi:hypothetical protein